MLDELAEMRDLPRDAQVLVAKLTTAIRRRAGVVDDGDRGEEVATEQVKKAASGARARAKGLLKKPPAPPASPASPPPPPDDEDISVILPGQLYLGSKKAAQNLTALCARGITHVLNCIESSSEGPNFHAGDSRIEYYRCPLQDRAHCPLLPHLPKAIAWAQTAIGSGGVVFSTSGSTRPRPPPLDTPPPLTPHTPAHPTPPTTPAHQLQVHCHSGKSRSGAVMAAYIMQTRKVPFADALAFINAKRKIVPNAGFSAHLRAFEAQVLGGAPPLPSEEEASRGATEFADRKVMELLTYGLIDDPSGWGEHQSYHAAFRGALLRGEVDWAAIDATFGY